MAWIETDDGVGLYTKDWGQGQPVVLIHGWPLSADSWEHQARALVEAGYRVVSYDRRGFGRSDQPFEGYDYDTLADDLSAVMDALELEDATLVGFSMGGGEVARYMSRHEGKGVARVAFLASVAPGLLKSADNPDGATPEVLAQLKAAMTHDRPAFFQSFLKDFYGVGTFRRPVSQAVVDWSWGMAMQASPLATIACVDAFGTTDFTADVAAITCPALIMHGTADGAVPHTAAGLRLSKMLPQARYIELDGAPHGILATNADEVNAALLDFLAEGQAQA
ncbi:alpha/beta fold hydrolase [Paracoccus sanguinis]|uniref:Arylesterase n=1 Tax=Paracoccus sanguinis TaxID=1545044 RepID=A0A099G2M6_9RHOB|nr:alpha/beta hydrolase [Paracoccus sanguinis]KGJ16613.1 arylesterase [Paracoccus sanguinis]